MTMSSCVIRCHPNDLEDVKKRVEDTGVCEIFITDEKGYLIVIIEGENIDEEMEKLAKLQLLEGVLSADMVYSYSEDELDALKEDLEKVEPVPEILQKEDVRAEEIVYHGNLKWKGL